MNQKKALKARRSEIDMKRVKQLILEINYRLYLVEKMVQDIHQNLSTTPTPKEDKTEESISQKDFGGV